MTDQNDSSTDEIDSLTDPESLANNPATTIEKETESLQPEHFEHWRDTAGLVGIGVKTVSGELLLWDGVHGWTLPYVEVDEEEDFAAVARDAVETLTGVEPTLTGVERATQMEYVLDGTDESLTTYEVVFQADPGESSA